METRNSFAAIVCGERLNHQQLARRNELLTFLVNYYMSNGTCCRKVPDWKRRLYQLKLQDLEDRFVKMFGRVL